MYEVNVCGCHDTGYLTCLLMAAFAIHYTVPPGIRNSVAADFSMELVMFRRIQVNHRRKAVFRAKCAAIVSIFLYVTLPQPCANPGFVY